MSTACPTQPALVTTVWLSHRVQSRRSRISSSQFAFVQIDPGPTRFGFNRAALSATSSRWNEAYIRDAFRRSRRLDAPATICHLFEVLDKVPKLSELHSEGVEGRMLYEAIFANAANVPWRTRG